MWNVEFNVCDTVFQTLVKTFEVCDLPVRASKFVARKNWVITGAVSFFFPCCYVVHKCVVILLHLNIL